MLFLWANCQAHFEIIWNMIISKKQKITINDVKLHALGYGKRNSVQLRRFVELISEYPMNIIYKIQTTDDQTINTGNETDA